MRDNEERNSMHQLGEDVDRYIEACSQQNLAERRTQLRLAAILCRCTPWYDHGNPGAAQYDCAVHTTIMFKKNGDLL